MPQVDSFDLAGADSAGNSGFGSQPTGKDRHPLGLSRIGIYPGKAGGALPEGFHVKQGTGSTQPGIFLRVYSSSEESWFTERTT